ncbi:MAG: SagB/ThcOx family dehydrogenase, partial [Planctomycetota bacterium]
MNRRTFLKAVPAVTLLAGTKSIGQELKTIELVEPQKDGGKSVMAALWERKTTRNIGTEKLSDQMLSNLLWAAFG